MKKSTSYVGQIDLMSIFVFSGLVILSLGLLSSFPAKAAEMTENEEIYLQLHRSIAAQERCHMTALSRAKHQKLARLIDKVVNYDIGAGKRLSLIQQAKSDVRSLTTVRAARDCRSNEVKALTDLFKEN